MKKLLYVFYGLVIGLFIWAGSSQLYRLNPKAQVPESILPTLTVLGEKALETKDVPVAAIVTYFDTIIGVGYNTVKRDFNLGGHAEINALSDAYSRFGDEFSKLDRSKLVLNTTFEPCQMCKGALVNNRIKNVSFELNKPFLEQVKSQVNLWMYEWNKRRFNARGLQESLFEQHPDYPNKK